MLNLLIRYVYIQNLLHSNLNFESETHGNYLNTRFIFIEIGKFEKKLNFSNVNEVYQNCGFLHKII